MTIEQSIAQEITDAVLERGSLTKAEILDTWPLSDDDYPEYAKAIRRNNLIGSGPRRVGGFVVNRRSGRLPDESATLEVSLARWERETVERLVELLQHRDLESLLGPLTQTLRQSRNAKTGEDRRGTKRELATALVLQHSADLFADKPIRKAIAKSLGINAPDKWHPKKSAAIAFVADSGFPRELEGIPTPPSEPDREWLEGRLHLSALEEFQQEVHQRIRLLFASHAGRAIVTLPTGAGKTRVAVEAIRDHLTAQHRELQHNGQSRNARQSVLWLAHTEELCEQAYTSFRHVWESSTDVCRLLLVRFWGQYSRDLRQHPAEFQRLLGSPSVLISTPQRIASMMKAASGGEPAITTDLAESLSVLLIDEAHRAAADSYKFILDHFGSRSDAIVILGLTATPFRKEYLPAREEGTQELHQLFSTLIEPSSSLPEPRRLELQRRGVLAKPQFQTIKTNTTLRVPASISESLLDTEATEKIDKALSIRADNSMRRLVVLERIVPIARQQGNSLLYFGPSVRDAECMTYLLREQGIYAAVVSAATRTSERRRVIGDFKEGRIRVLCNCEVLTTGFDAPRVTHIVMARPTVSRVMYEQIIGRGLRGPKFGGTLTCTILDCEDNYRGDRPALGYEEFRRIWEAETR